MNKKQSLLFILFLCTINFAENIPQYDPSKLSVTYSAMFGYVFKLLLIFAVIIGFLYIWKKYFIDAGSFQNNQNIKVIEKLQLDVKSAVYLIELNGKFFLIGTGDRPLTLLDSFGTSDPKIKYLPKKSFEDVLRNIKKRKSTK